MTDLCSAVYVGSVMHHRLRPRHHHLRYGVFWMLLDLDELDATAGRLRLFSRNQFNLFSFHDRDYGAGTREPLRAQVERRLWAAGVAPDGGPLRILTMPRVLGCAFNPLSVYFCHRRSGELACILYEVNNTFGERHVYVAPVDAPGARLVRHEQRKGFYVSPFLDMALTYRFRVVPPGDQVGVAIDVRDRDGTILRAALVGRRAPLTDGALARILLRSPLVTFEVIAGIHWEALKLRLKGVRLRPRPSASTQAAAALERAHDG